MKIIITADPHNKKNGDLNITVHFGEEICKQLPFVLQSGKCTIPHKGETIKKIPLKEGFTFSGKVLDEPTVDEKEEIVSIYLVDILISRDGRLQPELTPNAMAEILASKHLE